MKKVVIRWRFLLHLLSPPFAPPQTVIFCRFLRVGGKQKIPISLGNQDFTVFCFSSKWCHQESNRGHKDFQSFALPTELWHHYLRFCECKNRLFLNIKQIYGEKYFKYVVSLPKSSNFAPASTESSAVGSALRSGRRGRAFESPLSDLTDVPFKAIQP